MKLFRKSDSQKYDPWRHSEVGADFSESKLNISINQLTLIREFLGPSPSVISEKKSKIFDSGVTVGTCDIKIICADRVPVELSYDANFKWQMPICLERCGAEQKYMPFFGTVTERAFRKKIP